MTDDLLRRASTALREETAEADEGARFTRARVMASLQQSQIRRRSRVALLLPLAACFAAASAFGMATGRVPAFVRSVSHTLGLGDAQPPPAPAPARRKAPVASPAPVAPPATPSEELAPPPAPVPPVAEPRAAEPTRPSKNRPPASSRNAVEVEPKPSPAPAPASTHVGDVSDRAHELYRVAHRSHFVDHDFVAALRAWDAYLEAAPNGRFVLEARYNRALCLVRLGRTHDARAALAPFADSEFGGYRQEEARSLIDAMNR